MNQRNVQVLTTEFCKVKIGVAPDFLKGLFPLGARTNNLKSSHKFGVKNAKTVFRPKIYDIVPVEIKSCQTLKELDLGSLKLSLHAF